MNFARMAILAGMAAACATGCARSTSQSKEATAGAPPPPPGASVILPGGNESQPRRFPIYCAGIVVGMSTMRDAQRMYGEGFFVLGEGHGGGRYYVDPRNEVTLHLKSGVDDVVEAIEYTRGVRLPPSFQRPSAVPEQAVSGALTADERVQWGSRLGDSAASVLRHLGKPTEDLHDGNLRRLRYEEESESSPYLLFYEAEFRFENDLLVSVRIYNGC
jgi:hypothetical protein